MRGLGKSLTWRLQRLRLALYSVTETLFWVADLEEAPWYPDVEKLAEIARLSGGQARQATLDDLPLFRRYHASFGRPLRFGRIRMMKQRWAQGDDCYIALDRAGEITAQLWVAYHHCLVEGKLRQVAPHEAYHYGIDTRPDQRGSMGFLACSCLAVRDGMQRGRRRVVSWGVPSIFESFQRLDWWVGLGKLKPLRLERWTRVCGLRFCHSTELEEDWLPPRERPRARRS